MAKQTSPGINISEIDLSHIVPFVSTTDAAIAGVFRWGPVNTPTLVTSEVDLVSRFGKPSSSPRTDAYSWTNSETWFTSRNFLSYSDSLFVTRVIASPDATTGEYALDANRGGVVKVSTDQAKGLHFSGKYVGKLGNSLRVSYCKSGSFEQSPASPSTANETLTLPFDSKTGTLAGFTTNSGFAGVGGVGDKIILTGGAELEVESFTTQFLVNIAAGDYVSATVTIAATETAGVAIAAGTDSGYIYSAATKLITGDLVAYSNTSGTVIAGLTSGSSYYVTRSPDTAVTALTAAQSYTITDLGIATPGGADEIAAAQAIWNTVVGTTSETYTVGQTILVDAVGTGTGKANDDRIRLRLQHSDSDYVQITALGDGGATFTRENTYVSTINFVKGNTSSVSKYVGLYKTQWGDSDLFDNDPVPGTMHVVVKDIDGIISGTPLTVLETYSDVSWVDGRLNEDNTTNYITDVLTERSNWIECTDAQAQLISAAGITFSSQQDIGVHTSTELDPEEADYNPLLSVGTDGQDEADMQIGDMALGYDTFVDKTQVDISLVLQGKPRSTVLANYIINNICEVRKDCVVFISPELTDTSAQQIVAFAKNIETSNYAFIDSGYKYQLDKYSDRYRWVPLNGDIAGLCARTDDVRDPWFSPAGYARGEVKNITKLRFNANQSQRDLMYKSNVNAVISRPGTGGGHILFGDKTNAGVASAFDRINVRRLFIVLEKSIAVAAKATLFEFNDEFTRAQFKNMIEPFLRDVQGRRGIYDFMVVADETNNTPEVIDSNRFVGDIYIKPVRSINFIQLNFVAVRSGVEFTEVVGKF